MFTKGFDNELTNMLCHTGPTGFVSSFCHSRGKAVTGYSLVVLHLVFVALPFTFNSGKKACGTKIK